MAGFKRIKKGFPTRSEVERRYDQHYKAAIRAHMTVHVTERNKVIAGWKGEKPRFKGQTEKKGRGKYQGLILLTGDSKGMLKWRAVHGEASRKQSWIISAKPGKKLKYQKNYTAKHRYRTVGSFEGGQSGPTVYPRSVTHKGHQDKEIDEEIIRQQMPDLSRRVSEAGKKAN